MTDALDGCKVGRATEEDPFRVGCIDNPNARVVRLVHISDTHLGHDSPSAAPLPAGDVLVHSGDFFDSHTRRSFLDEVSELDRFFARQPHRCKIFVAGNHEHSFVGQSVDHIRARLPSAVYLQDNAVQFEGLKFYGSPWTGKRRSPASAFVTPYPELGKYWVMIPKDTDVLITHSPPHRILDDHGGMGCPLLRELVLKQIRPIVHLFGHAHQSPEVLEKHGVVFSNAAQAGFENCEPIVIDIYLPPTLAPKTKLYKMPIWKEEQENPVEAVSKKLSCAIL